MFQKVAQKHDWLIFPLSRCSMWIYCPVVGLVGTDCKLRERTRYRSWFAPVVSKSTLYDEYRSGGASSHSTTNVIAGLTALELA